MVSVRIAILCFLLLLANLAFALDKKSDLEAKEAFRTLHFAKGGKGMILSPGLLEQLNFFLPGVANSQSYSVADLNGNHYYFSQFLKREKEFKVPKWISRNFYKNWGLQFDDKGLVGFNQAEDRGISYGAMGCVVCHSGTAAGQFIIGLGNKNIDVTKMAQDVHRIEKLWWRFGSAIGRDSDFRDIEKSAMGFSSYLSDQKLGNLTQGLVPVSFIKGWFYRVEGQKVPPTAKGQVKVPHLWGYEKKRKVGQFSDGFGDGEEVGWAVAVELAAGQSVENVRVMYDDVHHAEELFNDFLPPKYPFDIDRELAHRGRKLFENNCMSCHGDYKKDIDGFPIYEEPKRVPWRIVKTDFDRLAVITPAFVKKVSEGPLSDIMRVKHTLPGYFAPRLEGIWARFPYLHNASVPNLYSLLLAENDRPKVFSLKDAGSKDRFDEKKVGLTVFSSSEEERLLKKKSLKRWQYDTRRQGHSPRGHNFSPHLNESERFAIIEYLKTL